MDGTHDSVETRDVRDSTFKVPFLRAQDIGSCYLREPGAFLRKVDNENKCKRSRIKVGDILLNIMASTGESCFYSDSCPNEANVNRAVGILRSIDQNITELDRRFIVALLSSKVGGLELSRNLKGSIQQRLNLGDIAESEIPEIEPIVRTYIGSKVQQAEQVRERSRELKDNFQSAIQKEFPEIFGNVKAKGGHSWAELEDSSLNHGAYQPERLRIRKYLKENGGKQVKHIATIETPVTSAYYKFDIYIGLYAISSASAILKPSTVAESEVEGSARVLLEGVALSKLRSYLNKVTYIPSELAGSFGSTELLCVQPKSPSISSWFLYGVLKLESTIRQLNPVSTGSTHPRVSREDVLDLMVPWLEDSESWGAKLENAQKGYFLSEQLTTAAKLLVEALIEGDLKESEIKTAQETLQQGDNKLDQEILSRLTRKGYNVSGEPPLFPNLDTLAKALQEAENSQEVE